MLEREVGNEDQRVFAFFRRSPLISADQFAQFGSGQVRGRWIKDHAHDVAAANPGLHVIRAKFLVAFAPLIFVAAGEHLDWARDSLFIAGLERLDALVAVQRFDLIITEADAFDAVGCPARRDDDGLRQTRDGLWMRPVDQAAGALDRIDFGNHGVNGLRQRGIPLQTLAQPEIMPIHA
jgi:hypothetical protein